MDTKRSLNNFTKKTPFSIQKEYTILFEREKIVNYSQNK